MDQLGSNDQASTSLSSSLPSLQDPSSRNRGLDSLKKADTDGVVLNSCLTSPSQDSHLDDVFVIPQVDQSLINPSSRKTRKTNPHARLLTSSDIVKEKQLAKERKKSLTNPKEKPKNPKARPKSVKRSKGKKRVAATSTPKGTKHPSKE